MSVTLKQILMDAKLLLNRLKEHDTAADHLLSQTHTVYKQIDAMKQYTEDFSDVNESSPNSNAPPITEIPKGNKALLALKMENEELKSLLKDHQNALELIMSKYRLQVSQLIQARNLDIMEEITQLYQNEYSEVINKQVQEINTMIALMSYTSHLKDDKETLEINQRKDEEISRLSAENKGLRELLSISRSDFPEDSNKHVLSNETEDNCTSDNYLERSDSEGRDEYSTFLRSKTRKGHTPTVSTRANLLYQSAVVVQSHQQMVNMRIMRRVSATDSARSQDSE